jgi:hypothetical protein
MSGESIQKLFEEERDEADEGLIDQYDISKIYDEGREKYNCDEPKRSLSTTPCAPIEEEEIDRSWLLNHGAGRCGKRKEELVTRRINGRK